VPEKHFRKGEVLFRAGDVADSAYRVREGTVEILGGTAPREILVAQLGPGEVFGEMALVEERAHTLTARAASDGSAATMSRAEFEQGLLHDPELRRQYFKSLFERLRAVTDRLADPSDTVVLEPVEESVPAAVPQAASEAAPEAVARAAPAAPAVTVELVIYPMTARAATCVPAEGLKVIRLPFRIGRAAGKHEDEASDVNDLWLPDVKPFSVSRNHLLIDRKPDGGYFVRDRGSKSGAWVNDHPIGGKSNRAEADLKAGDNVIFVGGRHALYQFRVTVPG
jgi:Cyclic nucleotide-binding domain/FHA domain